jgi:CRISPR-associated exonuclease Cas4
MLGGRNFHKLIEDELLKISNKLKVGHDSEGIHVLEITRCSRLSYFERMDPFVDEYSDALTNIYKSSITSLLNGITKEYKVDDLTIYVTVDLFIDKDLLINFVPVSKIPEYPHPNDLLYTNASMFIFDGENGFIVYFTPEGKFVEFSVSKSKRMFEQVVRRARILYLLLKEKKTPVVEPSELCFSCKYFQRCYGQQKDSDHTVELLGIGKKK